MNSTTLTIGLDLGDRRHAVCVLNAAGDIVAEEDVYEHPRVPRGVGPALSRSASRRFVFCRPPFGCGVRDGATTTHSNPSCWSRR